VHRETHARYDRLAARYDENWSYGPEFVNWMTDCILARLDVCPGDCVADIGCGTGLYARGLAERAGQVLCADPSAKMLEQLPTGDVCLALHASAEQIASGEIRLPYARLDAILIKEAIHHVDDREAVLHGLASLLADGGRLLVVMLPKTITYPLFATAMALFDEHADQDVAGRCPPARASASRAPAFGEPALRERGPLRLFRAR
jgi:ubiquinone/menaquinone biosynthesis C-methylase UbiE